MYKFFDKNKFQIIRFFFAGCLASGLNFLVFNTVFFISKKIFFASYLGYLTGIVFSFIFSKYWVFDKKSKPLSTKSFLIFCLIYLAGGLEMSLVINLTIQVINDHKIAWFLGALVGALNNYFGSKYLVFDK